MHPTYSTLTEMVAKVTIDARRATYVPADPGELERFAQRALANGERAKLRFTFHFPELALKQILASLAR